MTISVKCAKCKLIVEGGDRETDRQTWSSLTTPFHYVWVGLNNTKTSTNKQETTNMSTN